MNRRTIIGALGSVRGVVRVRGSGGSGCTVHRGSGGARSRKRAPFARCGQRVRAVAVRARGRGRTREGSSIHLLVLLVKDVPTHRESTHQHTAGAPGRQQAAANTQYKPRRAAVEMACRGRRGGGAQRATAPTLARPQTAKCQLRDCTPGAPTLPVSLPRRAAGNSARVAAC